MFDKLPLTRESEHTTPSRAQKRKLSECSLSSAPQSVESNQAVANENLDVSYESSSSTCPSEASALNSNGVHQTAHPFNMDPRKRSRTWSGTLNRCNSQQESE